MICYEPQLAVGGTPNSFIDCSHTDSKGPKKNRKRKRKLAVDCLHAFIRNPSTRSPTRSYGTRSHTNPPRGKNSLCNSNRARSQLAGVSSRPPAASRPTGENTELLAQTHISFCFSCGAPRDSQLIRGEESIWNVHSRPEVFTAAAL